MRCAVSVALHVDDPALLRSDQLAPVILWWKRIFESIPYSRAVSWTYSRIEVPSTIARSLSQGRKGKPSVNMSESERIPG